MKVADNSLAPATIVPSSYHSSQLESTTQSDTTHGTSEQIIMTETRCVTEKTMRMEHKSPHPDIEPLSFYVTPKPLQTITEHSHTEKTFKHEKIHTKSPTPPQQSKLYELEHITPHKMQTNSNSCETIKYTTFKSSTAVPDQLPADPNISMGRDIPINIELNVPNHLSLTPGPPPEIGYAPNTSGVVADVAVTVTKNDGKTYHSISDRVKLLESSLAECHDPPAGGQKVFPYVQNVAQSTESYTETMNKTINEIPVLSHTPEPIYRRASNVSVRSLSPRPSAEGIQMEKSSTSPSPVSYANHYESNEQLRKNSIRETTKAIENRIKEYDNYHAPNEYDLKAPGLVKFITPVLTVKNNLDLEPGTPPEMCYAARPAPDQRTSMVETIERSLERDLERGPSKVLPCSVRMMPPSPQNVPRLSPSPIKTMKPNEWHSGYTADTEESRYSTSCTTTEQTESKSAKQYFQQIDRQIFSPTKSYPPYVTDANFNLNHFPTKVRTLSSVLFIIALFMCFASVCCFPYRLATFVFVIHSNDSWNHIRIITIRELINLTNFLFIENLINLPLNYFWNDELIELKLEILIRN